MSTYILFAALLALAIDQTNPRDVPKPSAVGTGVVTGRVTAIATEPTPVRRAKVVLESNAVDGTRTTTADTDGRYRFTDLRPGTYRVRAEKSGYVALAHGARRFGEPGAPIAVKAGATSVADIALPRGAAIEGRVVDESGEPRDNMVVSAVRLTFGPYGRRPTPVRETRTDDLGRYRLHSLPAGSYHVMAAADPQARDERVPGAPRLAAARTFHPGTTNLADADRVAVAAGQDVSGVDFLVASAPLAQVTIRMVTSSGGKPARVGARLQAVGTPPGGVSGYSLPGGDSVVYDKVPPGDYWAMGVTVGAPGSAPEYAMTRLAVAAGDTRELTLTTEPASIVSGRIEAEGGVLPSATSLDVVAHAAGVEVPGVPGLVTAGDATARVAADGSFSFPSLYGPRLFRVSNLPEGWALAGVFLDDSPIADIVTDFAHSPRPRTLRIVVTVSVGRLEGKAVGATGRTVPGVRVVVFSRDPKQWLFRSRHVRSVVARDDGAFIIEGLLPGAYLACAVEDLNEGDWFDPNVLARLGTRAVPVDLAARQARTLTLEVRLPL